MTVNELISYVPTILSVITPVGAAVVWMVAERRKFKKELEVKQNLEADRERSYADRVTNRLKTAEETIERLTLEIVEERLKHNSGSVPSEILKTLVDNDPGLSWIKRRVKENLYQMVRVSTTYAKDFLHGPAELYDGKTDYEIWPKETAESFIKNDEIVYKTQEGQHIVEPMPGGRFVGRKFPIRLYDGQDYIVGIGVYEANVAIVVEEKDG